MPAAWHFEQEDWLGDWSRGEVSSFWWKNGCSQQQEVHAMASHETMCFKPVNNDGTELRDQRTSSC